MSDSAVNGILKNSPTREGLGKSARIAALFSLLGTDCRENIHTLIIQAREIFEADLCIYLAPDTPDECVASGCHLSGEAVRHLTSWAANLLPNKEGVHLLGREKLPRNPALDCRMLACIPVRVDGETLGMLAAGFNTPREFGPDDRHAAGCLAGALGFQHRLEIREQQARIGAMARQVAHDLNNILAGLVSYPELLLMQMEDSDPFQGPVSLMHNAGLQAAEMIRDFLILARPRAQQDFYRISPSASAKAYCQTGTYTHLASSFPQVRFSFFIDPDLPDIPGTDEFIPKIFTTLLHHGAQNLAGPGKVTVTLMEYLQDAGRSVSSEKGVLLRVEDNGARTDEKDLIHLFDPFYAKKTMGRQGTGLGLAAVKKMIRDQGGILTASSGPDRGTRFDALLRALP